MISDLPPATRGLRESSPRGVCSTRRTGWEISNVRVLRKSAPRSPELATTQQGGSCLNCEARGWKCFLSCRGPRERAGRGTGAGGMRMRSHWGVITLFTAAIAFSPSARAGNERGHDNDGRDDQCRDNDPWRKDSSDRGDGPLILHADADGANLFIHGTGFGGRHGTVTLGGQRLTIASWSPT